FLRSGFESLRRNKAIEPRPTLLSIKEVGRPPIDIQNYTRRRFFLVPALHFFSSRRGIAAIRGPGKVAAPFPDFRARRETCTMSLRLALPGSFIALLLVASVTDFSCAASTDEGGSRPTTGSTSGGGGATGSSGTTTGG